MVYVGAHYEKDVTGNATTSYYYLGGQRIAQRRAGVVYYLHSDHLGSASLTTDASGNRVGELRYKPYGETRYIWGVIRTDRRFTGQREEAGLGLYDYGARFYDPLLGRFISADTIVPGAAASVGGGAATLGYSEQTRLTPLTVGFHETQFLDTLNTENGELLQFGPPVLWDSRVRQEHTVPMGPANPQALNRYAYCLGNPLRYVDPTGHVVVYSMRLSADEVKSLIDDITQLIELGEDITDIKTYTDLTGWTLELIGGLGAFGPPGEFLAGIATALIAPEVAAAGGAALLAGGLTLDSTMDDLQELRYALLKASDNGRNQVTLALNHNLVQWSIEVNGEKVVSHWNIHPLCTPKGTLNATPAFIAYYFWFKKSGPVEWW